MLPWAPRLMNLRIISRRQVMVAVLALACLTAFVWLVRREHGNRLDQYKADLKANGEKLSLDELVPQPPPALDTNLEAFLAAVGQLNPTLFDPGFLVYSEPAGPGTARPIWAAKNLRIGQGESLSWTEMARQMDDNQKPLAAIRAAGQQAIHTSGHDYHDPSWAHGTYVQRRIAAQWLAADTILRVHQNKLAEAHQDLLALTGLAQLQDEDWTLVNQMIRVGIVRLGTEVVWAALQAPGWTDLQLSELQRRWEATRLLEQLPRTLEVERAWSLTVFDASRGKLTRNLPAKSSSHVSLPERLEGITGDFYWSVWRVAWSKQDELLCLRGMQMAIEALRRTARHKSWVLLRPELKAIREYQSANGNPRTHPLSFLRLSNWDRTFENILGAESRRSLCIAAIAIQRYELRQGKPPPRLEDLAPEFLSAVPIDSMNGQPVHYRLTGERSLLLYSVGTDGVDNGGTAPSDEVW
jgi:hypothetical protein